MAQTGDYYVVTLKNAHIDWGTFRYTGTREDIRGEAYLPIPRSKSIDYDILNSNGTNGVDELGKNLFWCRSDDGFFQGQVLAQGCTNAGDIYAKQFAGYGDLKAFGRWFNHINAHEGMNIKVEWESPTSILISVV